MQSEAAPEAIVHAAQATGSRAIAYTYNDPVIFLEYAVDVAKAAREQGIKNVAVTAGYISEKAREEFFSVIDAANIDLKAFTDGFYRSLCSAEARPRDPRIREARNQRLGGDHHAIDPRLQ